jgi:hypothetical protein
MKKSTNSFLSCGLAVLLGSTAAPAQTPQGRPRPDKELKPADIVEAVALQAQPAVVRVNDTITVTLTIRNATGGTLARVPWSILEPVGARFRSCGSGEVTNLGPNASTQVSCTTTEVAGPHVFRGVADPLGSLGESQVPVNYRANNTKELTVTVLTPGAIAGTEVYLSAQRAYAAGAGFSQHTDGTPCPVTLDENYNPSTMRVGIDCANGFQGGKVDFELYKNFTLKNGWKVKFVEAPDMHDATPASGSRFDTSPGSGSATPFMKVHSWSQARNSKSDLLRILITGPYGTDPYQ